MKKRVFCLLLTALLLLGTLAGCRGASPSGGRTQPALRIVATIFPVYDWVKAVLGDDLYGDRSFNRLQKSRSLKLCAAELTLHTEGQLPNLDGKTFKINPPF